MSTLGWDDVPLGPVVNEIRFAQSGARAKDGDGSEMDAGAGVENEKICWRQNRNAEGDGIEIVDQTDAPDRKLLRQRNRVHLPRQIRDLGAIGKDRPGHGKARGIDRPGDVLLYERAEQV